LALEFDVLRDYHNDAASRFGLRYRVSNAARAQLLALGRRLDAHNGTQSWELLITATYVIDRNGIIVFGHIDSDYSDRLESFCIINVLTQHT
jgi:peroxiredoxin